MPTINTPGSAHVAPAPNSGFRWLAYEDDNKLKKALQDAFFIIQNNIRGMRPCNKCFKALPGGKSFDDVWDDATVFVSFDPQGKGGTFGATLGKDVTITAFSLRMGRWTTAATLVHELAHVTQYNTWGTVGFLAQYGAWAAEYGYRYNPFELAARDFAGQPY